MSNAQGNDKSALASKWILDPKFFIEKFIKITNKDGELVPFVLKPHQVDFLNALRSGQKKFICLKARQMGMSTLIIAFALHYALTHKGAKIGFVAHGQDLTLEFLEKIKLMLSMLPDELRPAMSTNSKKEIVFTKMNSKIKVYPSTATVGRGNTFSIVLCLSGETTVTTKGFNQVKIKDLSVGDVILNGKGGFSPIKRIMKRTTEPGEKLLRVSVNGTDDLVASTDHPILVRDEQEKKKEKWKEAGELQVGDYLGYPYRRLKYRNVPFVIPSIPGARGHGYLDVSGMRIRPTREFGEFVGWCIAEGSFSGNKITLSIHEDEKEEVLRVCNVVSPYVNSISVQRNKGSRGVNVVLYGKCFSSFMSGLVGSGAEGKRIPDQAWTRGTEFAEGILKGMVCGDGCLTDERRVSYTTVSKQLAYQMKDLLVSTRFGLAAVLINKSERYGVKCLDRYNVILSGRGNHRLRRKLGFPLPDRSFYAKWRKDPGSSRWKYGARHFWAPVTEISDAGHEEFMYDITLEGDTPSFVANGIVVHNCSELAFWEDASEKMSTILPAAQKGIVIIESTPHVVGNYFHKSWVNDSSFVKKSYLWHWEYTEEEVEAIRKTMQDDDRFDREYNCMFSMTGSSVFSREIIRKARSTQLMPGQEVTLKDGKKFRVQEVTEDVYTEAEVAAGKMQRQYTWTVFKPPEPGDYYVMGGDTSEGVKGGDDACLVILSRTTGEEVASMYGIIPPDELAIVADRWGRKYNDAFAAIEINNTGGTTVLKLKELQYPNLYFRSGRYDIPGQETLGRLGWRTTGVTRPVLIQDLRKAASDGTVTIHTKKTIDEMEVLVYNMEVTPPRPVCPTGFHDDGIFATGIAVQAFHAVYEGELDQIDLDELPQEMFH